MTTAPGDHEPQQDEQPEVPEQSSDLPARTVEALEADLSGSDDQDSEQDGEADEEEPIRGDDVSETPEAEEMEGLPGPPPGEPAEPAG